MSNAETRGFEPPRRLYTAYSLSRGAHSATLPRLLARMALSQPTELRRGAQIFRGTRHIAWGRRSRSDVDTLAFKLHDG